MTHDEFRSGGWIRLAPMVEAVMLALEDWGYFDGVLVGA